MKFSIATPEDLAQVNEFYYSVIDAQEDDAFSAGWARDVYPMRSDLESAIATKTLVIGRPDDSDEIACSAVLNRIAPEGYDKVEWPSGADGDECTYIHLLGVAPAFRGQGAAKELLAELKRRTEEAGAKAIRLDVMLDNLRAERLYLSQGFTFVGVLPVYYEDLGWTDFRLLEYVV